MPILAGGSGMPRCFAITTSTPSVHLDGSGRGEVSFTVSNLLDRPVSARAAIEPEGQLQPHWLAMVEAPERTLARDGTERYAVKIVMPPGAPEGAYSFRLVVVNVDNPDEEFAIGPSVGFQYQRPVAPPRRESPRWLVFLAAGVLLLALGAITTGLLLRREEAGVGGAGSVPDVFLRFDGQDDHVDLGEPPALNFAGNVTVEAWIRPRATGGFLNILAHGFTASPPRELFFRIASGHYQAGSWDGRNHSVSFPIPPEDIGQWVHLAAVHDGAQWRLYRNGVEVASNADPVGKLRVSAPWAIGARGEGSERFFAGDIAQVRLWSVARTGEQIREGMRRAPREDAPGLAGSWPLSEGRGAIARDTSRNQAHGVLRGATWSPP